MRAYSLFIGGSRVADGLETQIVTNPATGESLGTVPVGTRATVEAAIAAATAAFPSWSAAPALERARVLKQVAQRMRERQEHLARLLTEEQGKPLAEARGEIAISADYFEWNAEEARRIYGESIPASTSGKRLFAIRQPVGVAASITPWNFPASMIARKIAPALAVGCTVIVKPASATPLSAMAIMDIFDEVGAPAGVVNLVLGPSSMIADIFLSDTRVRKISFTGSTEIGQRLMAGAASDLKRISLELGGHAPFIVFDDADLERAAEGIVLSKFRNAGQTCICANRLYVQRPIYERFATMLTERIRALRLGNGLDAGVDIGPMIDEAALEKVNRQVEDAVERGGRIYTGGKRATPGDLAGSFYEPTLVGDLPHDALVAHEETFGPLLGMWPFDTDDEAISLANATEYGLASYFYARDFARITHAYEQLQYGIIGVNDPVPTVVQAPFGGVKHSGFGREGGRQGVDEYLDWKFISIGL